MSEGWQAAKSDETGGQGTILYHKDGNWTVMPLSTCIVVKHTQTGDAKLILLEDGFIYLGAKDPHGMFFKPPAAICAFNTCKHVVKTREEGEQMLSGLVCEEDLAAILPNARVT